MQKILTPINVGATTNGSLRVEGVERGRATWREIGAVIKKHTAERMGGGFAENMTKDIYRDLKFWSLVLALGIVLVIVSEYVYTSGA